MYELGLVHSVRKDFLIVSKDMSHVPEVLRGFRVILYDPSAGLTARLREELLNRRLRG